MRWVFRMTAVLLCPICAVAFGSVAVARMYLPTAFTVRSGEALSLSSAALTVRAEGVQAVGANEAKTSRARIDLFGVIPVCHVDVAVEQARDVAVCGTPFGIKMFTAGVLVVGLGDVDTREGAKSPAEEAGLRVGDTIVAIDGETVEGTQAVARAIRDSNAKPLRLTVRRGGVEFEAVLRPAASVAEQALKAGMWIRDSAAGVGTLSFYDMHTGVFAGLGHPVNDADTGQTVPISTGEIVPASVFGVVMGEAGSPGELLGRFEAGSLGVLTTNDDTGLYGVLSEQPDAYATLPVAYKQEVLRGAAQMITTVDGMTPKAYDIEIEQVDYREDLPTKNMVIRVTDEELIAKTGGVLCGMSGSPIVQNGKLIGAVTHVFVSDPCGGYAIFAETMLKTAGEVPSTQWRDAA